MTSYHLAQLNIGRMAAPLDDPVMADFMNNLDRINALAEASPGYVWRLQSEEGNATAFRPYEDEKMIVNLTVWESIESLFEYSYKTEHVEFVRRRREFFEKMDVPILVLWWIPAGHIPTLEEAKARIDYLQKHGATPYAFTFQQRFTVEEAQAQAGGD